jgi:hypothetical protein
MAARDEVASSMTPKQKLQQRWLALKSERSTWLDHWRDIADHMRPRGWREFGTDTNRGTRKHQNIINSTPLEAARTLASGMMAGITSPSRPWFRLTLRNEPDLAEIPAAKQWLSVVEVRVREVMAKSNIYKGLHQCYADLGPFGTTAGLVDEDEEDDVRFYVFPLGSYCLATSERGDVNAIFREVSMTVAQVVEKFGLEACTESTQRAFNSNLLDQRINVMHAVYPNPDSKPKPRPKPPNQKPGKPQVTKPTRATRKKTKTTKTTGSLSQKPNLSRGKVGSSSQVENKSCERSSTQDLSTGLYFRN